MILRALWLMFCVFVFACSGDTPETAAGGEETTDTAGGEAPASEEAPVAAASVDGNFAITAVPQGAAAVGTAGRAEVTLEGRNGYHVNAEYPIQLTMQQPAGVELAKATLVREDASTFEEARAVFPVVFTPRAAGRKEFTGELSFSVCNPQNCLMERRPVTFAVDVP
jgi:hypothetical protein